MSLVPFHKYFPKLAADECRVAFPVNDTDLPFDEYAFTEAYCPDPIAIAAG